MKFTKRTYRAAAKRKVDAGVDAVDHYWKTNDLLDIDAYHLLMDDLHRIVQRGRREKGLWC